MYHAMTCFRIDGVVLVLYVRGIGSMVKILELGAAIMEVWMPDRNGRLVFEFGVVAIVHFQ